MLGEMKTFSSLALALALALPGTAFGSEPREPDIVRLFATCAGRLSATEEHQRMFDGPASERTAVLLRHMQAMTDAVRSRDQGREVLSWHLHAKQAHARLLSRATFSRDPRVARQAKRLARTHLGQCTGMFLNEPLATGASPGDGRMAGAG